MIMVNIADIKARLSEYLEAVSQGETVVICRHNRPVADTARLDPARDYYVRVTTRTRPLGGSFLGLTKTVIGQVKFTFVP